MAEDNLHRQKFTVEQWPTSKVTLYPIRASVVRQIQGVSLKAGLNEITISNLTALADPDSIRVAGTTDDNPARINDLTIDLVPNVYSSLSTLADDSDHESEDGSDSEDEEPESLVSARAAVRKITRFLDDARERKNASQKELALFEQYAGTVSNTTTEKTAPPVMKETLDLFASHRSTHHDTIEECTLRIEELTKERAKASKLVEKELKKHQRASRKKVLAREKKKAEKEERKRERKEKKPEKSENVYRVRITIEVPAAPHLVASSVTVEGETKDLPTAEFVQDATLILTYTTSSASWTPHYDLRLDTTHPSRSTLTYRAHFINRTFETWSNAQITLSTSQASFGGLNEKVPRMESWRVNLQKGYFPAVQEHGANGLFSLAEQKLKEEEQKALYEIAQRRDNVKGYVQTTLVQAQSPPQVRMTKSKKSKAPNLLSLASNMVPAPSSRAYGSVTAPGGPWRGGGGGDSSEERSREASEAADEIYLDADGATIAAGATLIAHAAAGADTYGFTTTYDLPTPRTVPSSALVRRHVIAEIPLPSLAFTHIVIPKLKPAAFLKARVANTSAIPLLPGQAGLTLDGSFLGNMAFPRCSPDETVVLELGVDQSVKVEYERPVVKRGSQGMMLKEEVGVFKRTMRITNTKAASVSLVVLDQIPVPEDEKLKVSILSPKGLKNENDVVKSGVGVDGKAPTVKSKKPKPVDTSSAGAPPPSAPSASVSAKLEGVTEASPPPSARSGMRRFPSFSKRHSDVSGVPPAGTAPTSATTPTPPVPPLPTVTTSTVTTSSSGATSSWGTAKATLRKNGEVRFDVDLLKGGCVSIGLEWECRMPGGDGVHALS